jgi:hypothetical protein
MAIDFEELFETLQATLERPGGVADRMSDLLNLANERAPDRQWHDLQEVAYAADIPVVCSWLESLFTSHPPGERVIGLWFGTEEVFNEKTEGGRGIYLVGSEEFDDVDNPWAAEASYEPQPRNLNCPSMVHARTILDQTDDAATF